MKSAPARNQRERPVLRIVLIAGMLLLIGFAAAWLYLQYAERQRLASSYTSVQPVAISRDGHSIAATFAIRTSKANARWALQNRIGIQAALHQALLGVDPVQARAPGGLRKLQQDMHEALNDLLKTDKVQEVMITDFLVSEGDY
jgi:hypothetical protein